jgi:hypothetical protein
MKPFRLPGDLPPLLVSPSYHLSVAACLVTAREISVFCHGLLSENLIDLIPHMLAA